MYSAAAGEGMAILAFVFMPDHLHLLVQGREGASLPRFMKRFKQLTAFWFKQQFGESLWQKGYYDHVLRGDEDLVKGARYIIENPVRAGLVRDSRHWEHLGGDLAMLATAGDEESGGDLKVAATGDLEGVTAESTQRRGPDATWPNGRDA